MMLEGRENATLRGREAHLSGVRTAHVSPFTSCIPITNSHLPSHLNTYPRLASPTHMSPTPARSQPPARSHTLAPTQPYPITLPLFWQVGSMFVGGNSAHACASRPQRMECSAGACVSLSQICVLSTACRRLAQSCRRGSWKI